MRTLITALAMVAAPVFALAQAASAPGAAAPKVAAKAAAKPAGKKLARGAQKAVEEVTPVDEDTTTQLTPAELEVARTVHVGDMKCELGATVRVTPMRREGFFLITTKGHRFHMHPAMSRTGAIRLEDPRGGAMWLQLGNKSMLMSQKLGQRLADECQSPQQVTYAEALKKNPLPSILDNPGPMARQGEGPASAATPASAPAPTLGDAARPGPAPVSN